MVLEAILVQNNTLKEQFIHVIRIASFNFHRIRSD